MKVLVYNKFWDAYVYDLYYFSRWEGNVKGFMRL